MGVIHARNCEHLLFQVLCEIVPQQYPVHVHCYTDSVAQAVNLVEAWDNLMIGFTGAITFGAEFTKGKGKGVYRGHPHDKPEHFVELLQTVPLSRMIIETDGPYMCPEPFRGQTSHPGHVHRVAERIAQIKHMPLAKVMESIRENTRTVYGI